MHACKSHLLLINKIKSPAFNHARLLLCFALRKLQCSECSPIYYTRIIYVYYIVVYITLVAWFYDGRIIDLLVFQSTLNSIHNTYDRGCNLNSNNIIIIYTKPHAARYRDLPSSLSKHMRHVYARSI